MTLPTPILAVLAAFRSTFTTPTWRKVLVLVVGTVLAPSRRTVTAALRQMGRESDPHFSHFHQVLNRARWSPLQVSQQLLRLLVATFVGPGDALTLAIDETLERRQGPHITKLGWYRDAVRSTHQHLKVSSGLRWITLALVIAPPWTRRRWALPFLSVLAPTPSVSAALGQRHKTVPDLAGQLAALLRRWLPDRRLILVGDGAYSGIDLGLICGKQQVALIAPLRFDAGLYAPPPPRRPKQNGRPRVVGKRLPKLTQVLGKTETVWQSAQIPWYAGSQQTIEWCTGTALWYRGGQTPLPIRWVLSRDPKGKHKPRAFFSTDPALSGLEILAEFVKRWALEVTFEESRAHLGFETQRQWSDRAIDRSTPCLLGLYSLITLWGQALHPSGQIPVRRTAWYRKADATFSDVLAEVRRHLWGTFRYLPSPSDPEYLLIPCADLSRLAHAVCYVA
jgi:DDE superfamily endonuclease